jgi:4-alpha-glucanotransferase
MDEETRNKVFEYCGGYEKDWNVGCEKIIKTMLRSHAARVILPIQDILIYGADTRMNTPGTSKDNWAYRISAAQLAGLDRKKLKMLNELYSRI